MVLENFEITIKSESFFLSKFRQDSRESSLSSIVLLVDGFTLSLAYYAIVKMCED